jgi:hypothetical protein
VKNVFKKKKDLQRNIVKEMEGKNCGLLEGGGRQ